MDYPNSGSMFVRDKKSEKAADYGGDFTIDAEVLDYVIKQYERGLPVKLELSAWSRQGRNNTKFLSLKVDTPWSERQQNSGTRQQAQGFNKPNANQMAGRQPQQREQIQTTRGTINTSRPGTQANREFRQDLNDDIPFGNAPQTGGNPWDD
jgi:hypothetical protein